MRDRLPALEGLRAVAAGLVVASHAELPGCRGLGSVGVWLFFALSGFLLTRAHLPRVLDSTADWTRYAIARATRILPAYYFALPAYWILKRHPAAWLWQHASFVRANAHFWSLRQEVVFYLALPAILLGLARLPTRWRSFTALAAAVAATWLLQPIEIYSPVALFGVAAACWSLERRPNPPLVTAYAALILVASASHAPLSSLASAFGLAPRLDHNEGWSLPLAYGAAAAWAVLGFSATTRTFLSSRIARWCGRVSYGVYLWHVFWMEVLRAQGLTKGATLFLLVAPLSLLTGAVSWYLVEQPLLRWREAPVQETARATTRG